MSVNFKKESVKPSLELSNLKRELCPEIFCAYFLNEIVNRYTKDKNYISFLENFRTDLEEVMQREGITPKCLDTTLLNLGF